MKTYAWMVLVAACGDPSIEYDDVARVVGATLVTSDGGATLGAVADSRTLASGGMPAGFTFDAGMTRGDHGALHHEYMIVQCRDRGDALQRACTPETNLATVVASWAGTLDRPGVTIHTSRHGMWTLTNLMTWMPSVTGTSRFESDATLTAGDPYVIRATESEAMLAPIYMMGGTIRLELDVTRGLVNGTIAADIVFDAATQSAGLTLDEMHYRIDLATGAVGGDL